MKKLAIILVIIIITLALLVAGTIQYRQYRSYKIPIHAGIQNIIKLNTDAFITSFLLEYGFQFSRKLKAAEIKKTETPDNTGLYWPGNIFVYTLKDKQPTTFFCTLPVYKLTDFKIFMGKNFSVMFSGRDGRLTGFNTDSSLSILCSEDYAAMAYSGQRDQVLSVLSDLLDHKNLLAADDAMLEHLKKKNEHIYLITENIEATLRFAGRQIILDATMKPIPGITIPDQNLQRVTDTGSLASFFINVLPGGQLFKKQYRIRNTIVDTDSLLSHFAGHLDLVIPGFTKQVDTSISYEYSDNFEKQEKIKIDTVTVPSIELNLLADPLLLPYLQKEQFVINRRLNPELFPLYRLWINQTGQNLFLHSDSIVKPEQPIMPTPYFMSADINFRRLANSSGPSLLQKLSKGLIHFHVNGQKTKEGNLSVAGSIDARLNGLRMVMDMISDLNMH